MNAFAATLAVGATIAVGCTLGWGVGSFASSVAAFAKANLGTLTSSKVFPSIRTPFPAITQTAADFAARSAWRAEST